MDSEFLVNGIWIPDSNREWMPASLSCIQDSKAQGTGLAKKIAGFRSPQAYISRISKSSRIPVRGARELTVERQFVVLLDIILCFVPCKLPYLFD